jgi:hypothetical protein
LCEINENNKKKTFKKEAQLVVANSVCLVAKEKRGSSLCVEIFDNFRPQKFG